MKITKKLIAEVKKSNKRQWHDAEWHAFQKRKDVEAVNYALTTNPHNANDLDFIKQEAESYLGV